MARAGFSYDDMPQDIKIEHIHFRQFAERHGEKNCRKHGVGAMREDFGRDDPEPVVPINKAVGQNNKIVAIVEGQKIRRRKLLEKAGIPVNAQGFSESPEGKALRQWRKALAVICKECGACKWADRPA